MSLDHVQLQVGHNLLIRESGMVNEERNGEMGNESGGSGMVNGDSRIESKIGIGIGKQGS